MLGSGSDYRHGDSVLQLSLFYMHENIPKVLHSLMNQTTFIKIMCLAFRQDKVRGGSCILCNSLKIRIKP